MGIEKRYYRIALFPVCILYYEILLRCFGGDGTASTAIYPVLFSLGFGLLLTWTSSLFSEKYNYMIGFFELFVVGAVFLVECLIHRSMEFYMPLDAVGSIADDVAGGYLDQVSQTVLYSIPVVAVFLLPAILYWRWGKPAFSMEKLGRRTLLYMMAGVVCFSGMACLIASTGDMKEKYTSKYDFDMATKTFGLTASMQLEAYYTVFGNEAAEGFLQVEEQEMAEVPEPAAAVPDAAEEPVQYGKNEMELPLDATGKDSSKEGVQSLNEYVKSQTASSQNAYTGLFKGKNLILICAEAFSHGAIDKNLTPTLYRLTHNGFYFSDYYQPYWGGSTSTGEYSMLMGLAPLRDTRTMPETADHNLYFTMGNQLQRLGYSGNAYHNGSHTYYSRHLTHENLGYDAYLAYGSGLGEISGRWTGDKKMMETTLPTYIDQQPFSVYYMTVSGHFPYEASDVKVKEHLDYVKSKVGDRYDDTTLYYLCFQMELEYALREVVRQLEAEGIADDTVICMTSDHYPYGLKKSSTYGNRQDYLGDLYGEYPETNWDRDKNSWILWSGCLENEHKDMVCEIEEPTYSLDILPTLSNLFGLEYDSRLLVGRDVFSDTEPIVLWTDYSWVTCEGKYDGNAERFYPNEGSTADEAYVERINRTVANKLSFSGKVHTYDYYGILFDE